MPPRRRDDMAPSGLVRCGWEEGEKPKRGSIDRITDTVEGSDAVGLPLFLRRPPATEGQGAI